jgi:protein O-GlcNAc transferase
MADRQATTPVLTIDTEDATSLRTPYEGCPICGGRETRELGVVDCRRHALWHAPLPETLRWLECTACHHQFTDSIYTEAGLRELFRKSHSNQLAGGDLNGQRILWAPIVQRVIQALPEPSAVFGVNRLTWVDVGCGSGSLVFTAEEFGFEAVGLDLRAEVVERIRALGYKAYQKDLLSLTNIAPIHVISMADVLEHTPYPVSVLLHAHKLLDAQGVLFLSCPNRECVSWRAMNMEKTNPYWFEIEHYHNFSRRSLMWLLSHCGFRPVGYGVSTRYISCMEIVAVKDASAA